MATGRERGSARWKGLLWSEPGREMRMFLSQSRGCKWPTFLPNPSSDTNPSPPPQKNKTIQLTVRSGTVTRNLKIILSISINLKVHSDLNSMDTSTGISSIVADPHHCGKLNPYPDPHPHQIKIRIRTKIWKLDPKFNRWIQIRINLQMSSQNLLY